MPRGIAWDELPRPFTKNVEQVREKVLNPPEEQAVEADIARDYTKDIDSIARRIAFGVVVLSNRINYQYKLKSSTISAAH